MEAELSVRADTTASLDIVVTSVSSDAHTWNLVYLQLLLEELGHHVHNLGACVPDELMVEECRRRRPDLVVISTVNGHGITDGLRVIASIRACAELVDTPIVIGGKLDTAGGGGGAERLIDAGFDAVFQDCAVLTQFRAFVAELPAMASPQPVGA